MPDCCTRNEKFCVVCFTLILMLGSGPVLLIGLITRAVLGV